MKHILIGIIGGWIFLAIGAVIFVRTVGLPLPVKSPPLPFEESIDWRRHCVIVDESDLRHVGDRLAAFHDALSADEFTAIQQANRSLWLENLSLVGFLKRAVAEAAAGGAPA